MKKNPQTANGLPVVGNLYIYLREGKYYSKRVISNSTDMIYNHMDITELYQYKLFHGEVVLCQVKHPLGKCISEVNLPTIRMLSKAEEMILLLKCESEPVSMYIL